MGKGYCEIVPKVNVGGEERESALFKDLLEFTDNNREIAKDIYSLASVKAFRDHIGISEKDLDRNGEVRLEALDKAINIGRYLPGGISVKAAEKKLGTRQHNGEHTIFDTASEPLDKVVEFNRDNPALVATVVQEGDGYAIDVRTATPLDANVTTDMVVGNQLNENIIGILRSMGFDVSFMDDPRFKGVFSPLNGKTNADDFVTVIQIAKGLQGQEALPEEFAHLMIAGLQSHPFVQRLLGSIDESVMRQVLGEQYDQYLEAYEGDMDRMRYETAGKLLANYIKGKGTVTEQHQPLLQRLWDWVRSIFSRITQSDTDRMYQQAQDAAAQLGEVVMDESVVQLVDRDAVFNSADLYDLEEAKKESSQIGKLINDARHLIGKRIDVLRASGDESVLEGEHMEALEAMEKRLSDMDWLGSMNIFIDDALGTISKINKKISNIAAKKIGSKTPIEDIAALCKPLRQLEEFNEGYGDIIRQLMTISDIAKMEGVDADEAVLKRIEKFATKVNALMTKTETTERKLKFNCIYHFLNWFWGGDKAVDVGNDKTKLLTLQNILELADSDIGFYDRFVSSMSDMSDPLLSLIDKVGTTFRYRRDIKINEILNQVRAIHSEAEKAGVDVRFMYERDSEGKPTGRIISEYDFNKFAEERQAYIDSLKEKTYHGRKLSWTRMNDLIKKWEDENMETVTVKGTDIQLRMPKKSLYGSDTLEGLNDAQRKYYDRMMALKATLDNMLPNKSTFLYNAVQIRNDNIENIRNNFNNPKELARQAISGIKDKFVRREDNPDFGVSDEEESADERKVRTDMSGRKLKQVPVYYIRPLDDMSRLSTDFSSSIMAYAAMAVNYSEMNKIVDIMELIRSHVKERPIEVKSGKKNMTDSFKVMGKKFSKKLTVTSHGSNIEKVLDGWLDKLLYGEFKDEQGKVQIGNTTIDEAMTVDAFKDYVSKIGLGFNPFSAISNVTMGKMQLFIEQMSGEYYGVKDAQKSEGQFWALLMPYLAELGSAKKTNKMALMMEKFDALEEFYRSMRDQGFYKGAFGRIMGNTDILVLQNIGEFYLHARNMLAMLNASKVKVNGEESSLYDALEIVVNPDTGANSLVLKEGTTDLAGQLLSTEGLEKGTELYEKVKKQGEDYLINQKMRMNKVSQALNGAFDDMDKGDIHRNCWGRLVMQFRQWMPAHMTRRWGSKYYDARLDQMREGFYLTTGRFVWNLMKDAARADFHLKTSWNQLSIVEKANIKRATTELLSYCALGVLCSLFAAGLKDKKNGWATRMLAYQLERLKLETGAAIPWFSAIDNMMQIVQAPAAAVNNFGNLVKLLYVWNAFQEVESGRYKGWSKWTRDLVHTVPVLNQVLRTRDLGAGEDYMFTLFNY